MIYKVAVVDDEHDVVENIIKYLNQYSVDKNVQFEVMEFNSGQNLLEKANIDFDMIFLDVNIPDVNGFEIARRIRRTNYTAPIIFCTNYAQYAVKGYEVEAIGYLIKPISKRLFYYNVDKAIRAVKHKQSKKLLIKTIDGQETILLSDVVYIEVNLHNIIFYVKKGDTLDIVRTRGSMRGICEKLQGLWLSRASASYLVNLFHVTKIVKESVELSTGVVLPVSRKYLKVFKEDFMAYLTQFGAIDV